MVQRGNEWASWEVDPSTRSSVHLWTKYVPVNKTVGASTLSLLTVTKGEPAVNLVRNPSFENADISEFEKVVTGTASQLTIAQDAANTSSPVADTNGREKLLKILRNTSGNSTQHYDGAAYKLGSVHATPQSPAIISARVSACAENNAAGNVKLKIWDAGKAAGSAGSSSALPLAESTAINLTGGDAWQEASVTYAIPAMAFLTDVRVGIVADTVWNMATYPYWIDKFMVEVTSTAQQNAYLDGSLVSSAGSDYEWTGTADLSISRKRIGLTRVRGFQIYNTHATQTAFIGIDHDASATAGISIPIPPKVTISTPWPIDATTKITAIASDAGTIIQGVIWGVHQN